MGRGSAVAMALTVAVVTCAALASVTVAGIVRDVDEWRDAGAAEPSADGRIDEPVLAGLGLRLAAAGPAFPGPAAHGPGLCIDAAVWTPSFANAEAPVAPGVHAWPHLRGRAC